MIDASFELLFSKIDSIQIDIRQLNEKLIEIKKEERKDKTLTSLWLPTLSAMKIVGRKSREGFKDLANKYRFKNRKRKNRIEWCREDLEAYIARNT